MNKLVKPLAYLVVVLLIAGGMALSRGDKGDETYEVTAYFTKAIGLFKNSDVDVLGVPVGVVASVEPVGTRVKVVMEIQKEHKIPADAFAQIVPISLISDRYIQLAPPYTRGPALEDGAVLDVDRTQIPVELDDVFRQLKKLLDAIEPGSNGQPGALGALIVQLDRTLKDREGDLRKTLIEGSKLTANLADANEFVSDVLINLDDLLGTLQTRAGSLGTLNRNFAVVMALLAESRADLEGLLRNLAMTTEEVGDLFKDNRRTLGADLEFAAHITSAVLRNRESVEQSLEWLPVVAVGLGQANHPDEIDATDVRDNAFSKVECSVFDPLPPPVREFFQERCREETGEPPPAPVAEPLDCDKGVRRVARQLRRLDRIALPDEVRTEITRPLLRKLRKLRHRCRELGEELARPQDIIDRILQDVGGLPGFGDDEGSGGDDGVAAGPSGAVVTAGGSVWAGVGRWFGGLLGFIGFGGRAP